MSLTQPVIKCENKLKNREFKTQLIGPKLYIYKGNEGGLTREVKVSSEAPIVSLTNDVMKLKKHIDSCQDKLDTF